MEGIMARLIDEHVNCSCGRDIAVTLDGSVDGATVTVTPQGLAPVAVTIHSDHANALVDAEAELDGQADDDDSDDDSDAADDEADEDVATATPAPAPTAKRARPTR
jgi:hypothetical protein